MLVSDTELEMFIDPLDANEFSEVDEESEENDGKDCVVVESQ